MSAWHASPLDHPRSRGVYFRRLDIGDRALGSSPLARGLPQSIPKLTDRTGIIPARAGFTVAAGFADVEGQGSSPLARGLHAVSQIKEGDLRIIPARAGFTFVVVRESSPDLGSSPLARGLPGYVNYEAGNARIIPARAGFTTKYP